MKISKRPQIDFPKTKEVLNQAVADLSVAISIIHQAHWYMRGQDFLTLHPKMDEFMDSLNAHLDEMSERLITIGGAPFSTLSEFSAHSNLVEKSGSYEVTMVEHLQRTLEVYQYLANLFYTGLEITDQEGDDSSNGLFSDALAEADKTIWMLQAELGQAPGI